MSETLHTKRRTAVRLARFTIAFLLFHIIFLTALTLMVILDSDKAFLNNYIHFSTTYMPALVVALALSSLFIYKTRQGKMALLLSLVHIIIIAVALLLKS
ncbi:hypothetical protein [Niabella aquatica]